MIAVTGANGLLGSFITRKLIESNQSFVAIKRTNSDTSLVQGIENKISWRDADVMDPMVLNDAFKGVDQVIHAAAMVSFLPRERKRVFDTNVQGTKNVLNACVENGVKRLVHISSVGALGRQTNQQVINEESKWVSNSLNTSYAKSKYLAELEVFRAQEEGLSTVMINPSVILAPADWDRSSAQLFKYVWQQKPFYIDGHINCVDVRDVAAIACQLVDSSIQGERFIVSAGNIAYADLFTRIAKEFQRKAPGIKLEKKLLRVMANLEGIRSFLTHSRPLITQETARLAGTHFLYDNQKIRKALNFEFQSIDKTLQWCCENYMVKINGKK